MTPQDAITHFGSQAKLAHALGIKQSSVAGWVASKKIPEPRQFQIEVVTDGQLKAERQQEQTA